MQPNHCHECPTRRACLAAELGPDALTALAACVGPGEPLARGRTLYRAGSAAADCYVVRSGAFKTVTVSADGEEHVSGFHFPGELIGLAGQATGMHQDTAEALETSTACRVPMESLPALWELGSGAALLRLIGRGEHKHHTAHSNLSRHAADARVAGFLLGLGAQLRQQGRAADYLPLPMSRTDLANHLGMTLECLSRVLARLARDGLLTAERHSITCHDRERLAALAGHIDPH